MTFTYNLRASNSKPFFVFQRKKRQVIFQMDAFLFLLPPVSYCIVLCLFCGPQYDHAGHLQSRTRWSNDGRSENTALRANLKSTAKNRKKSDTQARGKIFICLRGRYNNLRKNFKRLLGQSIIYRFVRTLSYKRYLSISHIPYDNVGARRREKHPVSAFLPRNVP